MIGNVDNSIIFINNVTTKKHICLMPFDSTLIENANFTTHFIQTITIGTGGLCTAILAMFGVWGKIIKPYLEKREAKRTLRIQEIKRRIDETERLVANQALFFRHIDEMTDKLNLIMSEFKPNGGSTLRDRIVDIGNNISIIIVERDATFQLSADAMFKADKNGYCTAANQSLCNLYGATSEQMLGHGWFNFISESDRNRVKEEWQSIIESGREISIYYYIDNPETGEVFPAHFRAIITRDKMGEVVSIIGAVQREEDMQ